MLSLTSPVRTRAHGWPAKAKLAGLCTVTVALFAVTSIWGQALAFGAVAVLYLLGGRIFAIAGARRLWVLWPFVAILAAWHLFDGTPRDGAVLGLRLVTAVGLANLLTMTTRLSDMIGVITWMATPLRRVGVSTRPLELAIALVLRFTPTLADGAAQLAQAWRARSGRRASWRIVAPLAVLALDEADHVAEALRARGGLIEGNADDGT